MVVVAVPHGGGGDTLDAVKKAGVLKWGADSSGGAPYVYGDPEDPKKIIGFEIDMMEKIGQHMGVKTELVQCSWPALLENLKDKRCDIVMNGEEINEAHLAAANMSQPYFVYEQQIERARGRQGQIQKP